MRVTFVLAVLLSLATPASAQKITIAVVPSVPGGATYVALDKGYFRDAGLDVDIERIDSLGKAVAFLATNQVQVAQGGINAGFYNSVAQGLPVALALESGSSPTYHQIIVRTELKDKIRTPADLKGRTVGLSSAGSSSMYEVASVLASAKLTLKDIEPKNLSFAQMATAMANGALDAAMEVAPFTERMIEQNIGVPWIDPDDYIRPLPMTSVGYIVNTDWAQQNRDTARKLFTRWRAPAVIIARPIITARTAPRSSISFSNTALAPIATCSTAWPGNRATPTARSMWRASPTCRHSSSAKA